MEPVMTHCVTRLDATAPKDDRKPELVALFTSKGYAEVFAEEANASSMTLYYFAVWPVSN